MIANECVIEIDYTLKNEQGKVIDSSDGKAPLKYLHGKNMLVPELENHLTGKIVGDQLSVKILAANGYGEQRDDLIQTIPKSQFDKANEIEVGAQFQTETPKGESILLTVTKIEGENVIVDGNHPLAGVDLYFDVQVISIREATNEELEHGHPHSEGGCGHGHNDHAE